MTKTDTAAPVRPLSRAAEEALVRKHEPLLLAALRRFSYRNDFDDLLQIGRIGLLRAIRKFDPERGNKFSTVAVPWIMQAVFNEFTRENRHKRGADLSAVSLNTCTHAIDREGDELQDFVVDPHAEFEGGAVARVQVERYCSILDERERTVLRMVSRGSPYIEIGRSLGVTKQRINQLHHRALKKIREVYWRDFQN